MSIEILVDKHAKYFDRFLGVLPSRYEKEDANKLAILSFVLSSLSILDKMDVIKPAERERLIDEVYHTHLLESGAGFRGSPIYALDGSSNGLDPANLAATFFALNILFLLKDESITTRLDRKKIMAAVQKCQLPTGEFCPISSQEGVPLGETDLRYCMIAASIRKYLQVEGGESDIDTSKLEAAVLRNVSYDGGIGGVRFEESHSGLTFCGLSALKLIDRISGQDWGNTIEYLVHRQIGQFSEQEAEYEFNDEDDYGGFNGRLNKFGDTCYGFWCLGSLKLIGCEALINGEALITFLSKTQNSLMGGFNKSTDLEDTPDPLHSYLGLVTLSILKEQIKGTCTLKPFNVEYMLPEDIVDFILSLNWGS